MQRVVGNPIAPTRNRSHSNGLGRNCKWTPEEDALLAKIVQGSESVNWKAAEAQFPGKTSQQIFERWTKVLDPTLLKGSWTREEDETIITFVRTYGCRSWTKLAKMLPGRIGKQCRERWMNHLNPDISRGPWTPAEDYQLLLLHEQYGNSWSKIAMMMPTRGDNMIKNRWYSTISKKTKEEVAAAAGREPSEGAPQPAPPKTEVTLPKPTFEEVTIDTAPMWTPMNGTTPFAMTPFSTTPGFGVTPTMGDSTSVGLISPFVPGVSPLPLASPYAKMNSMFSPWGGETPKASLFSPVSQKYSPPTVSENRSELVNLIVQQ